MIYIFELANNHGGSVEHAKRIIDTFGQVRDATGVKAGIKIQLRQLATFIHPDYHESDLKYVKRFKSTQLSKDQFIEILDHARSKGFLTVATPFDNESIDLLNELDIDIAKVASCSVDDWPLLREMAEKISALTIVSTAGATSKTLDKVYQTFKNKDRDISFLHCVGEYPTPWDHANLQRIDELRKQFPRLQLGISTHETPDQESIVPYAVAKGCTIVEKHVDVMTDDHSPNAYSCSPAGMRDLIEQVQAVQAAMIGKSENETVSLKLLKRGMYVNRSMKPGDVLAEDDIFYAMPCNSDQLDASAIDDVIGHKLGITLEKNEPVPEKVRTTIMTNEKVEKVLKEAARLLDKARVHYSSKDDVELSAHFGIDSFDKTGAVILNRVNREYCKKIIVMLPGQSHPSHHHVKKEEAFELIDGDCELVLNGSAVKMKRGDPVVICRKVVHSFSTIGGCVIEEVSTTHHVGDSIYEDPVICKLEVADRKIRAQFPQQPRRPHRRTSPDWD